MYLFDSCPCGANLSAFLFSPTSIKLNTVWDPTSTQVLFPLVWSKLHACTKAAWTAAKATWLEEQMKHYVSPIPVIRRVGYTMLGGTIVSVVAYKTYKLWRRNQLKLEAEKSVRVFVNDDLNKFGIPLPETVEEDWFLLRQDEAYYLSQGLPSRIYSDYEVSLSVYRQSGIGSSRWFCELLEKTFGINVRILEEPKRVTFYFEGPPRNISRARQYMRSVVDSVQGDGDLWDREIEYSVAGTSEAESTDVEAEPNVPRKNFSATPPPVVHHHEGDVHRH